MSPANSELQSIKADLESVLERRLVDLMAVVKASQEIARQIATADAEMEGLTQQMHGADAGTAAALRDELSSLDEIRNELVARLGAMTQALRE